jgi:diguanylate cyclase (GGDEF)-like protein
VEFHFESSLVGLTIHWGGVALVACVSFLIERSARRKFLEYWAYGWASLAVALTSLLLAFCVSEPPKVLFGVYFFAQYGFGYFLLAGCRNHVACLCPPKRDFLLLGPGAVIAFCLPYLAPDFNVFVLPHVVLMAGFSIASYQVLQSARKRDQLSAGMQVLCVGLVGLSVSFIHYALVCGYAGLSDQYTAFPYVKFASPYELLIELLLAFGMVMALLETVRKQLEVENHRLSAAKAYLQRIAEKDSLTDAFNRHAFYSFLQKEEQTPKGAASGCISLVDIDDFKQINDTHGHSAGDMALRVVAGAIRSSIRADDILFRWGGDEFLLLLVGVGEVEARIRLEQISESLLQTRLPEVDRAIDLVLSYGIARFDRPEAMHEAIAVADQAMYQFKQARKSQKSSAPVTIADF